MHGSKGNPCKPKMAPSKPKKKRRKMHILPTIIILMGAYN